MAYLPVLMYTGVTVVRECSGGRGDSPPATLSICLMPTLSTGVLIARSIVREVIASRCHGGKMSRSQQALVLKIWQEKKWKDNFPVHACTQEQHGSLYFFFHRSAMQIAVSVEKDLWDPDILRPRYYLKSHFSTLFSVIIAAVLCALLE